MIIDVLGWLVRGITDVWEFLAYSRRERLERELRRRAPLLMGPATARRRTVELLAEATCRYCRTAIPGYAEACGTCGAPANLARRP